MQLESLQRGSRTQLPARVGDRIDKAVGAGSRLRRLVDQLLDVSRLTAGGLRLEPERVDLSYVVSEIVTRTTEATARRIGPVIVRSEPHVIGRWDRATTMRTSARPSETLSRKRATKPTWLPADKKRSNTCALTHCPAHPARLEHGTHERGAFHG